MEALSRWGVPLAAAGLAGVWLGTARAAARISGWQRIAEVYPRIGETRGRALRFQSARVGSLSYPRCLTFGVNAAGLHLLPALPLRPAHPPLSVPWADVRASAEPGAPGGPVRLRFEREYEVQLRISRALADRLAAESCGGLVLERDG